MATLKLFFKFKFITFSFFILFSVFSNYAFAAPQTQVLPNVQTYDELVHAIRGIQAASQKRIDQAINQEKVREAWETGKLIDEHILHHKERADYAKNIMIRLAQDLGTNERELYYMLEFARAYPILRPAAELSWSHYQQLLSLNDPEEREAVTREAIRRNWSRDQVRAEVRRRRAARNQTEENIPETGLNARLGKVGIYRIIRATVGPYQGQLAVDLGFANYFQPDKMNKFKEGDLVALQKGKLKKTEAYDSDRYTYRAYVTQVIDGDTFKAVIDLGFNIVTEQKLRLRGLDAPEIESADGRAAKEFLVSVIASALPAGRQGAKQSTVLIKTVKSDKYDRYLADVWVGETYVNQKLIDEGLAFRVNE